MKREINLVHNLKVLGVSVIAALALGTALASASQAKGVFGAEQYTAFVKGTPTNELTFSGGGKSGTCVGDFNASMTAVSATLEVAPEYANCKTTLGSSPVTVALNGCTYSWTVDTVSSSTSGSGAGTIKCPAGKEMIISLYDDKSQQEQGIARCAWGIAAQGPVGSIGYTNLGSGKTTHIEAVTYMNANATRIKGSSAVCGGEAPSFILTGNIDLVANNVGSERVGLSFGNGGVYLAGEASADPAKQPRIEAEWGAKSLPVIGEQNPANPHQIKIGGIRTISCGGVHFGGELSGAASKLPLSAEYSSCTSVPSSLPTTVSMNSCHFQLNVLNVGPPYGGGMDIACTKAGDGIEATVYNAGKEKVSCLYKISPQAGLTGVGLETVGAGIHRGVAMSLGLNGTVNVITGTKLLCGGAPGNTTFTYKGGSTLFGL